MSDNLHSDNTQQTILEKTALRKKIKQIVKITSLGSILLSLLLSIWAFFIEPSRLVINKVSLSLPKWNKEHNGLKIALLTDLHVGSPHISLEKLAFLVSETNKQSPDLVVILGDLVVSSPTYQSLGMFVEPEKITQELKQLDAPLGVIAILGNHDWWYDGNRVRKALEQVNIKVLENNSIELTKNGKNFWISGLADLWTRTPDVIGTLAKIKDDSPILMLTHSPDIFPEIPDRVSLTLAGHTHGGQVKLPFLGRPIIPSKFGQRYAIGHIIEDQRHLYVGSGLGTSIIPVRFCVPPEIVILQINKE